MSMNLDINLFRKDKSDQLHLVRESVQKRFRDPKIVDDVVEADTNWKKIRFNLDTIHKEQNIINKEIGQRKKDNKDDPCTELIEKKNVIEHQEHQLKEEEKVSFEIMQKALSKIGNLVHESVPVSKNEDNNVVVRTWGEIKENKITSKKGHCYHHEILAMIDGYDPIRGSKVAKHKGYFLTGPGVMLNQALINYGLAFLSKRNYTPVQPPFFMSKDIMAETCQLSDYDESLYKVTGINEQDTYYLIATSEQPISAMHRKEWLEPKQLPIRYAGNSTCFRKEAGAYGKDVWGIFRIHQFEKIEQFVITSPEKSWEMHEEMIRVSEEFYQTLGLPYRVINLVSGELNDAAAKKYDLEAWFPGYGAYRELVSCSNCTDFQSRGLEVRYGNKKGGALAEKSYVHMLNGTLCATERTMCCILENYQEETGVRVPPPLIPFMGGVDFIPYVKDVPKAKDLQITQ